MELLETLIRRLKRIGVEVTFVANYPWIYLDTVNGERVLGRFMGNHGFTAFWYGVKRDNPAKFTDMRMVFRKIREIVEGKQHGKYLGWEDPEYDFNH